MTNQAFATPEGDYLSASQIETWRLCPRKWAWGKIDKIQGVPNVHAEKGTHVHAVLEAWLSKGIAIDVDLTVELSDGTPFKPGPIAAAGLKHLPMPKTCGTERNVFVQTPVAKYQGYIDWDVREARTGRPIVGDHKTTSDFKWAKTEADLRKDPQAMIYAAALMSETGAAEVELRWVYYLTRGKPQSKRVSLRVLRADVERNFDHIDATAAEIIHARKTAKTALDLPPNPSACGVYGGCPFIPNCNLSTAERMKAIMAQDTRKKIQGKDTNMTTGTLAERMKNRKNGAAAPAAGAGATKGAGVNAPEGPGPAPAAPAAPAAAAPPAATRLRMVRNVAKPAPVNATGPGAAPAGPVVANQAAPASAKTGFTLYIDCQPVKGGGYLASFIDAMEPAHAEVRKVHKVDDYRLIDFGKGPGHLAVALDKYLAANVPTGDMGVFVNTKTAEGRDTVNVFEKHASAIVRAVG